MEVCACNFVGRGVFSWTDHLFLGLLCVTCTDLAVLATNNYPEKWYVLQCRCLFTIWIIQLTDLFKVILTMVVRL